MVPFIMIMIKMGLILSWQDVKRDCGIWRKTHGWQFDMKMMFWLVNIFSTSQNIHLIGLG